MRRTQSLFLNVVVALSSAALILLLSHTGFLKRLELASLDFAFRLSKPLPFSDRILIVEISDADIQHIGRWPWERSWHAAMAKALTDLGARSIYFDIIFSETSTEKEDSLFAEAIKEAKNIYLPFVFQEPSLDIKNALLPLKRFSVHLKGSGAINISPDIDGVFRKLPLIFKDGDELSLSVALAVALDYTGLSIKDIKPGYIELAHPQEKIKLPLIEKNKMLINWQGKWKDTFKHYSFLEVLEGYKDFSENKKPRIKINDFKDSICLVAATAIGLYDVRPIPLEPEYPLIGVLANAISNILNKNFITLPPDWVGVIVLFILSLIPAFFVLGERPLWETIYVFLAGVIFLFLHFFLFKKGIFLDSSRPFLGLCASYFSVGIYRFIHISLERQRFFKLSVVDGLTGLFNLRYFKVLLKNEFHMAKLDPSKEFCIIMCDIDHFKRFNDTYGHQGGDSVLKEVANTLKSSVRSSDIVARYGGEEMIILLRGSSLNEGAAIAEKIRNNVENLVVKDQNNAYKVTISLGVSVFLPIDEPDSIIKRADNCLFKAKHLGRNRVESAESPLP